MKELMAKHYDKVKPCDVIKMVKRKLHEIESAYKGGNKEKFISELYCATELLADFYTVMKSKQQ